jgi:serine/threonine protein kinase
VCAVRHGTLDAPFALKLLHTTDATTRARFSREARALASMRHSGLVRVTDLGETPGGVPYLVMDFVDGQTLRERVKTRGPLESAQAVEVLAVVGDTLAYCHEMGILHRDVKPENVILQPSGHPLLVDFGLARRNPARRGGLSGEAEAQSLTQSGEILGTPSFMAPEQADADRAAIGPTTDVYGLASTLYFALTGRAPFVGASLFETLNRVFEDPPPDPRQLDERIPPALAEVCTRGMAKEPAQRPQTCQAMAGEMRSSLAGRQRAPRAAKLGLAIATLLALGLGLAQTVRPSTSKTPSPSPSEAPRPNSGTSGGTRTSLTPLPTLPTQWTQSPAPPWSTRRQPAARAWKGRVWVFPEISRDPSNTRVNRDAWSTEAGREWEQHALSPSFRGLPPSRFSSIVHRGNLFFLGGWVSSKVAWKHVTQVELLAGVLHARLGAFPTQYTTDIATASWRGTLWALGGADIDGSHSQQVLRGHPNDPLHLVPQPDAPWPRLYGHRALVFRDRLWVLGGQLPLAKTHSYNSVWYVDDPEVLDWQKVELTRGLPPQAFFSACTWRGRMWVGGGDLRTDAPRDFDLYYSVDGAHWEKLAIEGTLPSAAHSASLVPLGEQLLLIGGEGQGGTRNQVWVLR